MCPGSGSSWRSSPSAADKRGRTTQCNARKMNKGNNSVLISQDNSSICLKMQLVIEVELGNH